MEQSFIYFLTSSNMGLAKASTAQLSGTAMSNGAFMLLETDVLFFASDFIGGFSYCSEAERCDSNMAQLFVSME